MTRLMMTIALLLASGARAAGSARSDFAATAGVTGALTPGVPVRVALTPEVLAKAHSDFADIRLFDNLGRETPYVIYKQTSIGQAPASFAFEVVSYEQSGDSEAITLRRPVGAGPFHELELDIRGRDFNKRIEISAGAGDGKLIPVADDVIFDFSSRVNLRRTSVRFPKIDVPLVRVTLTKIEQIDRQDPQMRLRYQGLEFWAAGDTPGPFRVDRVRGWTGERRSTGHYYDRVAIEQPTAELDEDGNTVVLLDVRLPVARITLDVANSYYSRRVQLLTSRDGAEPYRVAGSGSVYKIPGMPDSVNSVRFDKPSSYLRLKIVNEDNPPLDIRGVEIAWVRRNLYFVPEPEHSYELFVGSDAASRPRYELSNLIPSDHVRLAGFAETSLAGLEANPAFKPLVPQASRETLEKIVLAAVVVVIVCALSLWAYRLLKEIPRNATG